MEVTGYVDDADLARRYANARVAVVPLRYGAVVSRATLNARSKLPAPGLSR